MDVLTVLTAAGMVTSVTMAIKALRNTYHKFQAQRKALQLIEKHRDRLMTLMKLLNNEESDVLVANEKLIQELLRCLEELSEEDREKVAEGFHQRSRKGRENYLNKLLQSGSMRSSH